MDDEKIDIYSRIRSDFINNYKRKAAPFFEIYEKKRKKQLIGAVLFSFFCALITFLFVVIGPEFFYMETLSVSSFVTSLQKFDFLPDDCLKGLGFGFLFFILELCALVSCNKGYAENQLKKAVMPHVCECFGDINLKWFCGKSDESGYEMLIRSSNLLSDLRDGDHICHDDIFQGIYGGIKFDILDTEITRYHGKSYSTIFNGVIIRFDMNKSFKGNSVIVPNGAIIPGLRKTKLEDIEFEKKFDVYTDDEVEARYLITTAFIERIKNINASFGTYKTSCSFYKNSLVIALNNHSDNFSLGVYLKKADYRKQCLTMLDEILSVVKLIDHFKLDTKIGL